MSGAPDRAELISTGAELLNGRTLNRHGQVLGAMLRDLGIRLEQDTTVIDDPGRIESAVRDALQRVPLVFVTGGLGPTEDDLTREALAQALGRKLVLDEASVAEHKTLYAQRDRPYTSSRERQAQVLEGADVLSNPVGIAPGQAVALDSGAHLFVLPGPPREFLAIMETHILPRLAAMSQGRERIGERILVFTGVGESDLHHYLETHQLVTPGVDIGWCAAPGRVELRLESIDPQALDCSRDEVKKHLGEYVFAEDRLALEEVVLHLLRGRGQTVAVAESCTGGLLSGRLTAVPGSSDVVQGGVVAYHNRVKTSQLGVPSELLDRVGAVSEEVAIAMAEGVRDRLETDWAVSVTGVAGPGGGTPDKPIGTVWIGRSGPFGSDARRFQLSGNRGLIRERTVVASLERLRRGLLQSPESDRFEPHLGVERGR